MRRNRNIKPFHNGKDRRTGRQLAPEELVKQTLLRITPKLKRFALLGLLRSWNNALSKTKTVAKGLAVRQKPLRLQPTNVCSRSCKVLCVTAFGTVSSVVGKALCHVALSERTLSTCHISAILRERMATVIGEA